MLLRFWTCVLIILYTYVGLDETDVPSWINELLIFLAVSTCNHSFKSIVVVVG